MSYTVKELRKMAKDLNIRGYSVCNKQELIHRLENHWSTNKMLKDASKEQPPSDEEVRAEVHIKPEELESLSAEELQAKYEKLESHINQRKKATVPKPPSVREDGSEIVVKRMRRARKPNAWDAFLKKCIAEEGGSMSKHMKRKEDYAKFKETWKPPTADSEE